MQAVDRELWGARQRQAEIPQRLAAARQASEAQAQRVTGTEAELKTLQLQQKSQELELGTKDAAIKKIQGQLFQVKTNKEYTALLHEIESMKADRSLLEDEILKLLDRAETAQRAVGQERAALEREAQAYRAAKAALDAEAQQLEQVIAQLMAQRQQLVPQVPSKTLSMYERVLANREELALVPVEQEACGGCHMALPPQVIHEVRMAEQLMACGNCARLLYWIEE